MVCQLFLHNRLRNYKKKLIFCSYSQEYAQGAYILLIHPLYSAHYEDTILFGDSNVVIKNLHMERFVNRVVQNILL